MKTNTSKIITTAVLAHLMCTSVVLSHIHAKDAVSLMRTNAVRQRMSPNDITAKALGDLHHHVDKASLKNMHVTATTRGREMNPLAMLGSEETLRTRFMDHLLRMRVAMSIFFQVA